MYVEICDYQFLGLIFHYLASSFVLRFSYNQHFFVLSILRIWHLEPSLQVLVKLFSGVAVRDVYWTDPAPSVRKAIPLECSYTHSPPSGEQLTE